VIAATNAMTGDPDYPEDAGPTGLARLRRAAMVVGVIVLLVAAVWWLHGFLATPGPRSTGVHQVSLVQQPPPPPPKPPEKLPEPPKPKEEVKLDEPKPLESKPDQPKPADDKPASDKPLAVDSDGAAGSDGFGLAARRGGSDLLSTGSSGSSYYSGLLQRQFFEALSRNRKILRDPFSVVVSVWLGDDGHVQRAEVLTGSGDAEVDQTIQTTLMSMAPLRELPPSSMRQIRLRLSNRA
jgi:outer membrane biosynthesis protein TonB